MTFPSARNDEVERRVHGWPLIRVSLFMLVLLVGYKIYNALRWNFIVRQRYNDIPHTPRHWFWGHLLTVVKLLAPSINQHPDYAFEQVWRELGQPPAYMVDIALVDRAMMVIADPSVAEAISQPTPQWKYSLPKSNTLQALTRLVGNHSLVLIEGDSWRTQRRRFNKGFSPAHLNTLEPMIVEKTRIFLDRIKLCAKSGEAFALKNPSQDLATDVITQLTIEKDFQAQTVPEGTGPKSKWGLLTTIKTMSTLTEKVGQGFELASLLPQRRIKEFIYDRLYSRAIYNEIVQNLPNGQKPDVAKSPASASGKAIVHLSLAGLEPSPTVLESTVSQVKTFLFAGQDTIATVIQWMAYELSKSYPSSPLYSDHMRRVRERLCEEHDAVFGKGDPFNVLDILDAPDTNIDEVLGVKLPYTTAFVKETLRLHPPAGSARLTPMAPYDPWQPAGIEPKPYFIDLPEWTHSKTGERHEARRVRADGMRLYNAHYLIQRNPNVWGEDAAVFDPSRFLDLNTGTSSVDELEEATRPRNAHVQIDTKGSKDSLPHPRHISLLPAGSYRPFERGPRTCIGSNLAMMEAKVVLAVIARGFEWTKVGLNGRPDGYARAEEDKEVGEARNWEVWSTNHVSLFRIFLICVLAKMVRCNANNIPEI